MLEQSYVHKIAELMLNKQLDRQPDEMFTNWQRQLWSQSHLVLHVIGCDDFVVHVLVL